MDKLVRFKQRRENLKSAFAFFQETLASTAEEKIKNAAMIKSFEMTFELCWKCLKDLLEYKGVNATAPRDVLKEAFKMGLIVDGQTWIDLLDQRNELVHIYNENQSIQASQKIKSQAAKLIEDLVKTLNQQ